MTGRAEPQNGAELALAGWLHAEQLRWSAARRRIGLAYAGPAGFVAQHGEFHQPEIGPQGSPGQCYGNAIAYAASRGWTCVEGFTAAPDGSTVFQHAWNIDQDGRPLEVTWPIPGAAYCGVAFAVGRADEATWDGDANVLDDFRRGWPLLRQPWTGEDHDGWPPSDRLRLMRGDLSPEEARRVLTEMELESAGGAR